MTHLGHLLAGHLRKGDLATVANLVDDVLLVRHAGLNRRQKKELQDARLALAARRMTRGGKRNGTV